LKEPIAHNIGDIPTTVISAPYFFAIAAAVAAA